MTRYSCFGFARQARQLRHFIVRCDAAGAEQHANAAFGKIVLQLLDDRKHRIVGGSDAENEFVFRIVLPAEAREILVRVGIKSADRLQIADRWSEIRAALVRAGAASRKNLHEL